MPNYNFLYSSTPLGTSSADSSKKKPSLNPHFRAPCIYMNSPEPHLLNTRNPSIPVIDALTSRLGNPWVLSPTSLSAWRTLQTLTLCETFLCTDDDFARVGVFVAKHDDDAVCQGHIRDLRGLCASRGRNLVVLDLHEGGKKELVQGYGVNSLRVDLKGESTEAVVEGIIKWILSTLSPLDTLAFHSEAALTTPDLVAWPGYSYCKLADESKRSRGDKIQFVAVVLTRASVSPQGDKLTWKIADRTGIVQFTYNHRLNHHSPNRKPADPFHTWNWVLSLQPGQLVSVGRMECILITETTAIRVAKLPLRMLGSTVATTGSLMRSLGAQVEKAGEGIKMGKQRDWVYRANAVYLTDEEKWVKRGSGKRVAPWPRWMKERRAKKLEKEAERRRERDSRLEPYSAVNDEKRPLRQGGGSGVASSDASTVGSACSYYEKTVTGFL